MDTKELQKKIDLILNEELRAYAARGRRALGSMNVGLQSLPNNGWTTEGQIPQILFERSDPEITSSPNASILIKLYSTLDREGKGFFVSYLLSQLNKNSQYAAVAYFIFFVLYKINETIVALKAARKSLSGDAQQGYSNLLGILSLLVSREYFEIDKKTYEEITSVLDGDTEYNFQLNEKINLALLKHLERDLDDVNPEINVDRDKILEVWGKLFSNIEVPSLISQIEDYFREGEFTETKFSTCIDRIRILIVEISKRIALGLAVKKTDGTVTENSDEHTFFNYLRDKKFITDSEWNILRSLYALASDKGAHNVIANREYARLIKNMTYELVLLFLSKYKL